jgi:hypothetical protein
LVFLRWLSDIKPETKTHAPSSFPKTLSIVSSAETNPRPSSSAKREHVNQLPSQSKVSKVTPTEREQLLNTPIQTERSSSKILSELDNIPSVGEKIHLFNARDKETPQKDRFVKGTPSKQRIVVPVVENVPEANDPDASFNEIFAL